METAMTPDVNIALLNFPNSGKEMVVENEDGSFTILINSKLSYDGQIKAYNHAMKHIQNNDFQKKNVQIIETMAHDFSFPSNTETISAERYIKRIKAIQARRKIIIKRLQEVEDDLLFLEKIEGDRSFSRAESQWLYGNDL